jgi:hypothetical protein
LRNALARYALFDLGLNLVGYGGEPELAQVAEDQRVNLVSVGVIKKKRPLHGPGKEFADPSSLVCCELPAG